MCPKVGVVAMAPGLLGVMGTIVGTNFDAGHAPLRPPVGAVEPEVRMLGRFFRPQ